MPSIVGNNASGLDVDWLLHKKETNYPLSRSSHDTERDEAQSPPPPPAVNHTEATPPQSPVESTPKPQSKIPEVDVAPHEPAPQPQQKSPDTPRQINGATTSSQPRQAAGRNTTSDDTKTGHKSLTGNLKRESGGRRPSWITSLSSKFGSSTGAPKSGPEAQKSPSAPSPQPSPKIEFGNPFNKNEHNPKAKEEPKPVMVPLSPGRRQSVLVAAGKETKLDQPGFLSSALRRLSSSTNTTMGKGGTSGALCPRRIMNVDQNRQRVKIPELEQNKLKRVAFCVDVEIAGRAAQADEEEPSGGSKLPVSNKQAQNSASDKKDTRDAKYKDMNEGAALKNASAATDEKEVDTAPEVPATSSPPADLKIEKIGPEDSAKNTEAQTDSLHPDSQPGTTRKKEKKKRSEAERKERREKKRKHAEANGLVPLELVKDDDSDSSPTSTPGISTPRIGASPTTDPLRIYKRCCQLRETTVLSRIKEQISKPAATLAEAPGTVAVIDLSGLHMQLQDVQTFGDWLAIVPVRKLVLDNCNLNDESIRIILSGLTGCKSPDQARSNRRLFTPVTGKAGREQMGIIEKLSLKHNSDITNIGWKYIALFLHVSRSLKAIDLSGIPFPKSALDLSRASTLSTGSEGGTNGQTRKPDYCALISRAISERFGDRLEELILSDCGLTAGSVSEIVECLIKCKIRRLGLAGNDLDQEAIKHVVRYILSGICEGLDLGGNNLHNHVPVISDALGDDNPLFAVSFAGCNMDAKDLDIVLRAATRLKNLKFIDLSSNHALFSGKSTAVPVFRKMLPKLTALKRIHLANAGMLPDHVIALAEVLPDCPSLCHVSILDNQALQQCMNSKEGSSQEEACAFFASLMTAVRVSHTIVAIEVEVPSAESSEVVKALASQVVAYSLRNMERSAMDEIGVKTSAIPNKDAPEVLLHLVGHMDGVDESHDADEPAPDEDYVIASTGIVKALGVCLGTGDGSSRSQSRNITPSASGTSTPRQIPQRPGTPKKPRDVSLELCESARKIRMRLRPALVKEDKAGNDEKFRRLFFLDQTLQRIIQRFEDEYPETKVPELPSSANGTSSSPLAAQLADDSVISASVTSATLEQVGSAEEYMAAGDPNNTSPDAHPRLNLARTPSNQSLAAKAYTDEEGRMHRFGQGVRREVLRQSEIEDTGDDNEEDVDAQHLADIRSHYEDFKGEEIRSRVETEGPDEVLKSLGMNAKELLMMQREDPGGFAVFRDSQIAAQINSGRRASEG